MDTLHTKHLLVGAGAAGDAAADAIRNHDPEGSILLVGQETSRPYYRPALVREYLLRLKSRVDLNTEPIGWYSQQRIELRTGRRVAHLDTARRSVMLDNGEEIAFDGLLLATGASPQPLQIPGSNLPNLFYLRTIEDADRLHHAIEKARREGRSQPIAAANPQKPARGRAVVIGSGLPAVELASSLKQIGLHVELVVGRMHPWGDFAGESTGRLLEQHLQDRGIVVRSNVAAERLEGDGRVQRVVTTEGQPIDCDFVVGAIGTVVNRELLRGTPIAAEKAILVDDRCRTNVEGIYAAGDCAAVFDPLFGKHRVLEHWDNARVTGALAGANMAGATARYNMVSFFTSQVSDLTLHAWGEARLVHYRLIRGTPSGPSADFAEIGVAADGRVAQVLAIGRAAEHEFLRELVRRRLRIDGLEEQIKDPTRDLRDLMAV